MERWQEVERIFHAALQRGVDEREAYLRQACGEDSGLFREVWSLLTNDVAAVEFEPWAANAAAQLIVKRASLFAMGWGIGEVMINWNTWQFRAAVDR